MKFCYKCKLPILGHSSKKESKSLIVLFIYFCIEKSSTNFYCDHDASFLGSSSTLSRLV